MKINTWRIIKAQHAHRAFDGEGARLAGSLWNKIGIPMVYTADSLALAALEILVHLPGRELLKRKFLRIPVRFDSRRSHLLISLIYPMTGTFCRHLIQPRPSAPSEL